MYTIKHATDDEARAIATKAGDPQRYNVAPPGWREIDAKTLVQRTHYGRHAPRGLDHRQIHTLSDGSPARERGFIDAALYFYYDGTGIAIETDFYGQSGQHLRYYAFGCEHRFDGDPRPDLQARGITLFRCQHAVKCSKCGHFETYDSSD